MDIFVARQPIFNKEKKVLAYELLYRSGNKVNYAELDGDVATSSVVVNTFISMGIDQITKGQKAFINFTQNLIKEEVPSFLPKDSIVIEILENVIIDYDIIEAIKKLKDKGYIIALDDFELKKVDLYWEILPYIDIIKVDFLLNTDQEKKEIVKMLNNGHIKFLAEKIETNGEFEKAVKYGYIFFQGYFFEKPVIVTGKTTKGYKFTYTSVLNECSKEEPDFDEIADVISSDINLSYKLLKLINSTAYFRGNKISSIKSALVRLGLKETKKWVILVAMSDMALEKPDELLYSSLIRAKAGELLADLMGMNGKSSELFLLGLLSLIDVFTNRPIEVVVTELPVIDEVKDALLGKDTKLNEFLKLIIAYQKGKWTEFVEIALKLDLDTDTVANRFIQAIKWTDEILDIEI